MPVLSWAHSQYWQLQAVPAPETGASSAGGYVPWMTTVTAGSLGGSLQPWYEWLVYRVTLTVPEKATR